MENETVFWRYVGLVVLYTFLTIVRLIFVALENWREKRGKSED